MARTKNTEWKAPLGHRYPLAEYGRLKENESTDLTNKTISNLYETNQQFIRHLLDELIDRIVSIPTNTKRLNSGVVVEVEAFLKSGTTVELTRGDRRPDTTRSLSSNTLHEERSRTESSIPDLWNLNFDSPKYEANKENEVTQQMHDNHKDTNQELHIQSILKEAQENKKIVDNENQRKIMKPAILVETVASTSCPIHIKKGKPFSFYESYYTKNKHQ